MASQPAVAGAKARRSWPISSSDAEIIAIPAPSAHIRNVVHIRPVVVVVASSAALTSQARCVWSGPVGQSSCAGHDRQRPWPQADIGGHPAHGAVVLVAGNAGGLLLERVEAGQIGRFERGPVGSALRVPRARSLIGEGFRAIRAPA